MTSFEKDVLGRPADFRYRMLSRFIADAKYYKDNPSPRVLWSGDAKEHAENMIRLYDSFSADEAPEWVSRQEILDYAKDLGYDSLARKHREEGLDESGKRGSESRIRETDGGFYSVQELRDMFPEIEGRPVRWDPDLPEGESAPDVLEALSTVEREKIDEVLEAVSDFAIDDCSDDYDYEGLDSSIQSASLGFFEGLSEVQWAALTYVAHFEYEKQFDLMHDGEDEEDDEHWDDDQLDAFDDEEDLEESFAVIGENQLARAFLASDKGDQSMIKLTKEEKDEIADTIWDELEKFDDGFIVGLAEDFTCEDEDGISDLDLGDMKALIADEIVSRIETETGWTRDGYVKELNDLYRDQGYLKESVDQGTGRLEESIDGIDAEITALLRNGRRVREGISTAGLKVTYATVSPTKIYDTYKGPIIVRASINGLPSEFVFRAARSDDIWFTGVDCNSATIDGKRVDISNGGGQTHYALQIYTNVLKAAPKTGQKDFRFTGRVYSTSPVIPAFKKALQDLFKNGDLTHQFLKAVGCEDEKPLTEALTESIDDVKKTVHDKYCCDCGEEWEDDWDCAVDDECQNCGKVISPSDSATIVPGSEVADYFYGLLYGECDGDQKLAARKTELHFKEADDSFSPYDVLNALGTDEFKFEDLF